MGTAWVTPSPESSTTPVVLPVAYLAEGHRTDINVVFLSLVFLIVGEKKKGFQETSHKCTSKMRGTHRLRTACMEMNSAGTLKVSKNTSAARSLFLRGFRGASVNSTGCW